MFMWLELYILNVPRVLVERTSASQVMLVPRQRSDFYIASAHVASSVAYNSDYADLSRIKLRHLE